MNNSFVKNSEAVKEILQVAKIPKFRTFSGICRFVTKRMVHVYDLDCADEINRGYCFIWAYLVASISNEELEYISSDGHVVLFHSKSGLHFDSEHLRGRKTLDNFCGMGGYYNEKKKLTHQEMTLMWALSGRQKMLFREIISKIDPSDVVVTRKGVMHKYWNCCVENVTEILNRVLEEKSWDQMALDFS